MTKATGLLLGCLSLLAASIVAEWADAQAVASANAATAELDRKIDVADQRLRQAEQRVAVAARESWTLETSLAQLTRVASAPAAATRSAASASAIEWAKRWEKQLKDPKAQNENLAIVRAQLHDRFAPLYRELHLTAQQIAAFEDNEAIYHAKQSDLTAALLDQRIAMQDPVAQKLFGKLGEEENAAQKLVLGDSGYTAFQEFERTAQVRDLVSRFDGAVTVMGAPLNSNQAEQLVGAIAAADTEYAKGGSAGRNIDWDRALTAAAPLLSPAQLDVMQNSEPPGGGRFWSALNTAISNGAEADRKSGAGEAAPSH